MIHGQQARSCSIIKKLATLFEEITEMIANITSQMGAAQLLFTEILDLVNLTV